MTMQLAGIQVRVEASSGNVEPLLHEIRHGLNRLLRDGATTCIDLRAIPLAPGEEELIVEALGRGEVRAEILAMGRSEVAETGFPGVWLITHLGESGGALGRFIEITRMPEILQAPHEDIADGLARLGARLAGQ
jgi:HupH hydrogenase expression protein